jgi:hypothetical protein
MKRRIKYVCPKDHNLRNAALQYISNNILIKSSLRKQLWYIITLHLTYVTVYYANSPSISVTFTCLGCVSDPQVH